MLRHVVRAATLRLGRGERRKEAVMLEWMAGSVSAAALGGAAYAWSQRTAARRRHYRKLAERRGHIIRGHEPTIAAPLPCFALRERFAEESIICVRDFLTKPSLERLRQEAMASAAAKTRSYIPTHKKGGTVGYEALHQSCPACLAVYHGAPVQLWVAALVGQAVGAAGDHDQSANSLLYYDEPGDHIHWHYDRNFYRGRQFTALLNVVNRDDSGGISASTLMYKSNAGIETPVDTSENCFIVFEGATVLHRATPTKKGDLRVMLSMTFNTDPRISAFGEMMRRVKDTAFFGMRVLWA
jgi:hypothetical protein